MPILKDFRQTKTITLPSFPDSKVEIYDSLTIGELRKFNYAENNQLALTIEALPHFIKSWNFTDEAGKDLEINADNLSFLKEEDARFLMEAIAEFNKEAKKKIKD
jgi:hypothetical protein